MNQLPQRFPLSGLPDRVTVYEVGARDGLQNESGILPTAVKAEFLDRLTATGLSMIEATSFVHPKLVPQLADAEQLLSTYHPQAGVRYPALVPNLRGYDRASSCGVREIAVFASATETFARKTTTFGSADTSPCASATPGKARSRSTRSSPW